MFVSLTKVTNPKSAPGYYSSVTTAVTVYFYFFYSGATAARGVDL